MALLLLQKISPKAYQKLGSLASPLLQVSVGML